MSDARDSETAMFVLGADFEHLGCGSLVHELAHRLLLLQKGDGDGGHKNKHVWKFSGVIDLVKIKLGCQLVPIDLRVWK
jgi:hypothetical protein